MKRASQFKDTYKLFEMIKKLPVKPHKVNNSNGTHTITTSIHLSSIYGSNDGLDEIEKWLEENNLSIARDGAFGLTNSDFLFTCLLHSLE